MFCLFCLLESQINPQIIFENSLDTKLSLRYLPKIGNSLIIHKRNLKILATKIFKIKNGLNTKFMDKV